MDLSDTSNFDLRIYDMVTLNLPNSFYHYRRNGLHSPHSPLRTAASDYVIKIEIPA